MHSPSPRSHSSLPHSAPTVGPELQISMHSTGQEQEPQPVAEAEADPVRLCWLILLTASAGLLRGESVQGGGTVVRARAKANI